MKWQHKPSNAKPVSLPEFVEDGEWLTRSDLLTPATPLTDWQRDRLTEKYGNANFDRLRAKRVSDLMKEKKSVREIAAALKHYGRGYSLRSITTVHAALNPSPIKAVGEGLKKRSNSPTATRKFKLII
jgi:hypothetical protein